MTQLRLFPRPSSSTPPPPCDRCGGDVDTLTYAASGDDGALLCDPCMKQIADFTPSPADLRPVRLRRSRWPR